MFPRLLTALALTAALTGPLASQAAQPAPETAASDTSRSEDAPRVAPGTVELVSPAEVRKIAAETHGRVIVLLSSKDDNCKPCVRSANPDFAQLAAKRPDAARYVMVDWQPWTAGFKHEFVTSNQVDGLPTFLSFKDGVLVASLGGSLDWARLGQRLLSAEPTPGQRPIASDTPKPIASNIQLVQDVTLTQLHDLIKNNQNFVLQILLPDQICPMCQEARERYDKLAARRAVAQRYYRITLPSLSAVNTDDAIRTLYLPGLPAAVVYRNVANRDKSVSTAFAVGSTQADASIIDNGLGSMALRVGVDGKEGTFIPLKKK